MHTFRTTIRTSFHNFYTCNYNIIMICSYYTCLIRDTAGQERFFTFTKQFFRGTQVCGNITILYVC